MPCKHSQILCEDAGDKKEKKKKATHLLEHLQCAELCKALHRNGFTKKAEKGEIQVRERAKLVMAMTVSLTDKTKIKNLCQEGFFF